MIEVTNEMVKLALDVFLAKPTDTIAQIDAGMSEALTAVLAIVERDYEPIRCDNQSWAGHRCTKPRGHDGGHQHRFSGVVWP